MRINFKKYSFFLVAFLAVILFASFTHTALALETKFPNIPGLPDIDASPTFPNFVDYFLKLAVLIAGALAVFSIVYSGVKMLVSAGDPSAFGEAKERIIGSLSGVVLLMFSFIILQTINPSLTNLGMLGLTSQVNQGAWLARFSPPQAPPAVGAYNPFRISVAYADADPRTLIKNWVFTPAPEVENDIIGNILDPANTFLVYLCEPPGPDEKLWLYDDPGTDDTKTDPLIGYGDLKTIPCLYSYDDIVDEKGNIDLAKLTQVSLPLENAKSLKMEDEKPGVRFFTKANCTGDSTETITQTGALPTAFQNRPILSAKILNGNGQTDPRYSFVLTRDPNARGACSIPYSYFSSEDIKSASNPGGLCIELVGSSCGGGTTTPTTPPTSAICGDLICDSSENFASCPTDCSPATTIVLGCMDPGADNFNLNANTSDGSCTYSPTPACIPPVNLNLGNNYVVLNNYTYLGLPVQDWQNNSEGGRIERWYLRGGVWYWQIDLNTNNMVEGYFSGGQWKINGNPQNWIHYNSSTGVWENLTYNCSSTTPTTPPTTGAVCGDLTCNSGETITSCPTDCGSIPTTNKITVHLLVNGIINKDPMIGLYSYNLMSTIGTFQSPALSTFSLAPGIYRLDPEIFPDFDILTSGDCNTISRDFTLTSTSNRDCYITYNYNPVLPPTSTGAVSGCTSGFAINYNPLATIDDGSCISINTACFSYDANCIAGIGTCSSLFPIGSDPTPALYTGDCAINACSNPPVTNFNPFTVGVPTGTCFVLGCKNPLATNYNPAATVDNGSCKIPPTTTTTCTTNSCNLTMGECTCGTSSSMACTTNADCLTSSGLAGTSICGNGTREPGEECDDGNTVSGDGCSSTCLIELVSPIAVTPPSTSATGKLTVNYVLIKNGGTETVNDFTLYVDGIGVVNGAQNPYSAIPHIVSVTPNFHYNTTFSGDCDSGGNVVLNANDIKTCTITNTEKPADLTVTKVVINHGQKKGIANFPLAVDTTNTVISGVSRTFSSGVHTVSEIQDPDYNSSFTAGNCDQSGQVTLEGGVPKTCTLTNEEKPSFISLNIEFIGGPLINSSFNFFIFNYDNTSATPASSLAHAMPQILESGNYNIPSPFDFAANKYSLAISGACDSFGDVKLITNTTQVCTYTYTYTGPSAYNKNNQPKNNIALLKKPTINSKNFFLASLNNFSLAVAGVGCTDPLATNFDPTATTDDGSCTYLSVSGCTNPSAINYNAKATTDDGSCIAPKPGCTDPSATNFDANANQDNGSCTYLATSTSTSTSNTCSSALWSFVYIINGTNPDYQATHQADYTGSGVSFYEDGGPASPNGGPQNNGGERLVGPRYVNLLAKDIAQSSSYFSYESPDQLLKDQGLLQPTVNGGIDTCTKSNYNHRCTGAVYNRGNFLSIYYKKNESDLNESCSFINNDIDYFAQQIFKNNNEYISGPNNKGMYIFPIIP